MRVIYHTEKGVLRLLLRQGMLEEVHEASHPDLCSDLDLPTATASKVADDLRAARKMGGPASYLAFGRRGIPGPRD